MKKIVVMAGIALLTFGLGLGAAVAADAPKGPVVVKGAGSKDPVTFKHDTHKDMKCVDCHHNDKAGKAAEKYSCFECHKTKDELKDAYHKKDIGVCSKCHFGDEAKNKMKCAECHIKK